MALFQAATVSADAISNGIGFLFIAGCLRLNERAEIREREWGGLLVLIFLLFLAKLNLVPLIVLPFLLISPSRFPKRGHYVVLVIGTLLLFIVEVVGWTVIATQNASPLVTQDADLKVQMFFILENPFRFLWIVVRDVFGNGLHYLQGWINGYGYYYWTPPVIVSLLFLLSLVAVLLTDPMPERLGRRARIVLLSVFLLCYLATVAPLYLTFTAVGADRIDGVQGRYFVPLALLLFLPLASSASKIKLSTSTFLGLALVLNILGIYLSFHVECGSTFYQTGLCYRPLSKDLTDPGISPPITGETSLDLPDK
jgi:uncharacterized membrane protein